MAPRRAPDERGPFLGTEQIIKRLREVRQPFWRQHLRRGVVWAGCTSALLLASAIVFDRVANYRRAKGAGLRPLEVDSHVAPSLDATYDASGESPPTTPPRTHPRLRGHPRHPAAPAHLQPRRRPAPVDAASAPRPDADADSWGFGESADAAPLAPSENEAPSAPVEPTVSPDDPATSGRVRIQIDGGPGSIFVDGKRLGLDTRWDIDLTHGEHYLMVRLGGRSMTYKLRLRGPGVKVVFDDQASEIREEAWPPRAKGP